MTQHKLLVADITVDGRSPKPRIVPPRRKVWKLRNPNICKGYETFENGKRLELLSLGVNDAWNKVKTCLLLGVDHVCVLHAETWCWNDDVDQYIREKWRLWRLWKMDGSKEDYLATKKCAKPAVYIAKKVAQETRFTKINTEKDFKLANFQIS